MKRYRAILLLPLFSLPTISFGHHSVAASFLTNEVVEIEGIVRNVRWSNPHVYYTVDVSNGQESIEYRIEAGGISELRTRGIDREFFRVGDEVRVAGYPSRHGRSEIFGTNVLLPSGEEVLFDVLSEPYFEGARLLDARFDDETAESARRTADGIFRVWGTVLGDPDSFPMFKGGYPLTEAAERIKAERKPEDYPYNGCFPKPMPHIMVSPTPMEIRRQGEDIEIRIEEYDIIRVIDMNASGPWPDEPPSGLGQSRGRWEDDDLIVETRNITPGYFHNDGTPQSSELVLLEQFDLSESETDWITRYWLPTPRTSQRRSSSRYWVWRPAVQVGVFDCQVE